MYNQYRPPTGGFGGPPPPPFGGPPAPAYGQFGGAPSGPSFGSGPSSQGGAGRDAHDDKLSKVKDPLLTAVRWLKGRSSQEKLVLGCLAGVVALLILWRTIEDHDTLFVLAEVAHFVGIGLLAFKMYSKRSAAGLSAQTQILTMLFLVIRLYCSFMMEYDIHTVLDGMTLIATSGVLYALWFTPIKSTYQADLDNVKFYYVVIPCVIMAAIAHPFTSHWIMFRILWAVCVYLEAVSVLPQLRMMQNSKVVERFTAHYVFCLGLSRFFSCAHWILQLLEGNRYLLNALGSGLWPVMVLLSEIVQTFILADFCFYYVKSYAEGSGISTEPAPTAPTEAPAAPTVEEMANVDKAVKKSVKGEDWIDDDEYSRHKILLGLGSLLVAIGAPLLGCSAKKVDTARKQRK
ncbi:hypothetical protein OEZ85_012391 [Tetradesmus obliquus]|uniref:ER lumen protein-retaining receptor n=1 Tax=Tetradesmus obliquus TaxID=3088 RepID=A0ABY8TTA7_TETOB|nr:hypothetical protein OEZ85_012391 [Tetradesmus obliquus]